MKSIIFDVGGVLVDYIRDDALYPIAKVCRAGTNIEPVLHIMASLNLSGGYNTLDDFYNELVAQLGFFESKEKLLEYWIGSLSKRDWVDELLSDLAKQTTIYILSDTNHGHWSHIASHLINLQHFERIFLSHELLMMKTSDHVFHHVLREIDQKADQCLFIDDTFSNIEFAQSCGLKTHHYQDRNKMVSAIKDHCAPVTM
ncbi:MAG: FMN phosphatase YigB (HAD superfamily) [Flavobacterium sp.]|jgi:FMN phosphatase YigB (HAD superfamily)